MLDIGDQHTLVPGNFVDLSEGMCCKDGSGVLWSGA